MLILSPEADDKVVEGVSERIGQVLRERGGEISKVDRWGKRRLAYEISRFSEGYYVIVEANAEPEAVKELDRVLALADEVLRFKTVVRAA